MAKRFVSYLNNYEVEMKEKGKATFKSYISDTDNEDERKEDEEEVEKSASEFFDNMMQPNLLPGEQMISQADSALRFAPYSDRKQGISGNLFVTNFKVAFVTADKSSYAYKETKHRQRNKLIDDNDIPLTSIEAIFQVMSGGKRRALVLGQTVSSTSKYLEIHCKDFRIHVFGFKFVPKDQNKRVTNSILHHACPTRDDLLFAYEFGINGKFKESSQQRQFFDKRDWEGELARLKCEGRWRVTDVNKSFQMSTSLPEYFVVPWYLTNADLQKAAGQYIEKRLPTWCYTYTPNGASLVRMSQLLPESDFKTCEENLLAAVKMSSGDTGRVEVLDLTQLCPSLMEIRASSQRLMTLCMTDSTKEFYGFDSTWLSRLDSSQWLQHVASCLHAAADVTQRIKDRRQTVALKEESGYDVSCVISCLVQLILDPAYRTQGGFSSLVQREWVVMGHPFQRRSHLVQGSDGEQSPVFLLFLDCVWQLLQQFPSRLGFTETFLTSLWDSAQLGVTDTFLFDSAWQRHRFYRQGRKLALLCLPSAWEWHLQFSEEDILLFNNPLYSLDKSCSVDAIVASAKGSLKRAGDLPGKAYQHALAEHHTDWHGRKNLFRKLSSDVLSPVSTTAARLRLWSQCYLRWCVPAQILGGGRPAEYLRQCLLVEEVVCLDHRLKMLQEQKDKVEGGSQGRGPRPQSGLVFSLESRQHTLDSLHLTSSFPFPAAVTAQMQHKLINGPLSLYLHDSLLTYQFSDSQDD